MAVIVNSTDVDAVSSWQHAVTFYSKDRPADHGGDGDRVRRQRMYLIPDEDNMFVWDGVFFVHQGFSITRPPSRAS